MNVRTGYSARSVQAVIQGRENIEKTEKNLKFSILKRVSDKIMDL